MWIASFLLSVSVNSCDKNTSKSSTLCSLKANKRLFWTERRKPRTPAAPASSYSGICSSCLKSTMTNSTICSCFWLISSFGICRISFMCKIIVSITFGAKKCFLLTWSYLNKSSLIRPSQSRCGNSVSCTNSIMHKKDSFLSYVWKMSSGKRSFCKKFHLPNVWRTNGSL